MHWSLRVITSDRTLALFFSDFGPPVADQAEVDEEERMLSILTGVQGNCERDVSRT